MSDVERELADKALRAVASVAKVVQERDDLKEELEALRRERDAKEKECRTLFHNLKMHDLLLQRAEAKLQRARAAMQDFPDMNVEQLEYVRRVLADLDDGGASAKCGWEQDSCDGAWATACNHNFEFTEGTPEENNAKFCMFCGSEIEAFPTLDEGGDDAKAE